MDTKQCLLTLLYISLLPLSANGQEWSKKDSLKLRQLLESDREIKINRKLVEEIESQTHQPQLITGFDPALPKVFPTFKKNLFPTLKKDFLPLLNSTFLPNYARMKLGKNVTLQSNSNFTDNKDNFHIQTNMEYKLSDKWSLNIYGTQNLDNRRYKGLPSEVEPTAFGTHISFKINKRWKIKTDMQYQYNAILKRWEFVPQTSITYEW